MKMYAYVSNEFSLNEFRKETNLESQVRCCIFSVDPDMARVGWFLVGEVEFTFSPYTDTSVVKNATEIFNSKIKEIQANTEKEITRIRRVRDDLLALPSLGD